MAQLDLPPDEPPTSEGERRSRERIARTTVLERMRRRARLAVRHAVGSPRSRHDRVRRLIAPLVLAMIPTGVSFAIAGALLPGLSRPAFGGSATTTDRSPVVSRRPPRWIERA